MPETVATKRACPGLHRVPATIAAAAVSVGLLSACTTSTTDVAGNLLGNNRPDDIPQEYFLKPGYCPPVRLRAGTETFATYERGHEAEPSYVRYQASITRTARECAPTADGFAIDVGVAGRVVAGPKGGAGEVTLPIRVVVTKQSSGVLFSQLYKVPVSISPPNLNADFSEVARQIAVKVGPDERDLLIYVGFDDGTTS